MVFIDTPLYKAWEKYVKETGHRFYEYGHSLLIILIYELLLLISRTPHVLAYNGVDAWFKYLQRYFPWGTLMFSLLLLLYFGDKMRLDWVGHKDWTERMKDRQEQKKNKDFKPKQKSAFKSQFNRYYAGFMALEGFAYGTLLIMLLPDTLFFMMRLSSPEVDMPPALDESASLYKYHSNPIQDIALAFGAGFYEELVFRVLLFGLLLQLGKQFQKKYKALENLGAEAAQVGVVPVKVPKYNPKDSKFQTIIAVGSLIYAFSHYLIPYGDTFSIYSFLSRFFFGVVLYVIFVRRNLAIAAWTHVVYDLWYFIIS